ncbi:peptidoglycan-binding protein [Aeromonas enteropelogenes]|uniref:peptidoglycan-binding protein n=1 Tax=Aeromonas enteropelogenes TaxID=29489 RepID=UPI003BA15667
MKTCNRCPAVSSGAGRLSIKALRSRMGAMLFDGPMNREQSNCVGGVILAASIARQEGADVPLSHISYVLATIYHETARTMRPIEEYGKGKGRPYGEPDPETGQAYYGRGYVQLTWRENYARASRECWDRNLAKGETNFELSPELMLTPFYAAQAALIGMSQGWFTGKSLGDYDIQGGGYDYVGARHIINGSDRDEMIAGIARTIEQALRLATGQGIQRPTLSAGSRGGDVVELQMALGLPHDGVFGSQTKNALAEFQKANGLANDGVCGKNTWAVIDSEVYGL